MLIDHLSRRLLEREQQGLLRRRRTVATPCGPHLRLDDDAAAGTDLLAFCSNDYLGLARHPSVVEALADGARRFGAGSGASHLISGHGQAHAALEDWLAAWLAPCIRQARVLSFSTGYMANLALMTALADDQTALLCDRLNHASLIDGALLARCDVQRYPHGRLDRVEALLSACDKPVRLIVTDGVFSMDGDVAPLVELLALAERHDAWLVIDDAHGLGVLGAQGRGSLEAAGLCSERLILMGTLGKAAGVAGAFVAAHPTIVQWLMQAARPYIYTTATPPAVAHAALAGLMLIDGPEGRARRAHLQALIAHWRASAARLIERRAPRGWQLAPSHTAIQPLIVGANTTCVMLSAALETRGLWVPAIRPPTVPAGTARLRVTLSASHQMADVDRLVAALDDALDELPPDATGEPAC